MPFDILVVNNNSMDDTASVLERLECQPGPRLRIVMERESGIVPARNRVLAEAANYDILVLIDDDENPRPGTLAAAYDAIANERADCVGGPVVVDFGENIRPPWLSDDLLGFLAHTDYGPSAFWVKDDATPVWTSNVAYRMAYVHNHNLLFDSRYNRRGESASDAGGGEDAIMFRRLLDLNARIRYRPDMVVDHRVEAWRLRRRYFLRLHYLAGVRRARLELGKFDRAVFGVPRFLFGQFVRQSSKALAMLTLNRHGSLRQAMNAAHALGLIRGSFARKRRAP